MKKFIYSILTAIAFLMLFSCNDFLTQESENSTSNDNFWNNELEVSSAVDGLLDQFRSTIGDYSQNYRDRGCIMDQINLAYWRKMNEFDFSGIKSSSGILNWTNEYHTISVANFIIDNVGRANLTEDRYKYYIGQALCIRAYTYFHIIRLWGDAPLVLTFEDMGEKARTPWREIADQIVTDLKLAVEYLPMENQARDVNGSVVKDKGIPNKGTANAILAHVYGWIAGYGQEPEYYEEGIKAATAVINDPNYRLVDNPEEVCIKVFKGNSCEGIFEISYDESIGEFKTAGSYLAGALQKWPIILNTTIKTKRTYYIKNTTVSSLYVKGDKRVEAFFEDFYNLAKKPVSETQGAAYVKMWPHIVVYENGTQVGQPKTYDMNEILIRLPDIILLRAEMEAATNNLEAAKANLNLIRKRAGVSDYTPAEGDLKRAIQLERDKELLFQTLVRYFDHMRNHTYNELKGGFKSLTEQDVTNGALFLPVGTSAFVYNPAMKQTVYWNKQFRH